VSRPPRDSVCFRIADHAAAFGSTLRVVSIDTPKTNESPTVANSPHLSPRDGQTVHLRTAVFDFGQRGSYPIERQVRFIENMEFAKLVSVVLDVHILMLLLCKPRISITEAVSLFGEGNRDHDYETLCNRPDDDALS
jgi:hypothetical protein